MMTGSNLLEEVGGLARGALERVTPSLASVGWRGTGTVIAPGLVLTAARAARREAPRVRVAGGEPVEGRAVAVDADAGLAVLAAETGAAPALEWAPDAPAVGDLVFAVAALPDGTSRITIGFVSTVGRTFRGPRGRRITGSIEHTAAMGRGAAGGPLLDAEGRLVGLNGVRLDGGLALAVAADADLRARIDRLAQGESPERRTLGVAVLPARVARHLRRTVGLPERDGLLVRDVQGGSPAERAGVLRGDLIATVAGAPVRGVDDLFEAIDAAGGGSMRLGLVRGVEERDVDVPLD
jgi:S1-C subfamily serine protease